MNRKFKIYIFTFLLFGVTVIGLSGFTCADNVEIKLGSGDGFKVLDSGGSPLMDILSNGYVGIGTSPNYELDVSGDINFTGSLYQNGTIYGGGSSAWTTSGSVIYYNSGNVGIGTVSPAGKLEVKAATNRRFIFTSDASKAILEVRNDDETGRTLQINPNNNVLLATNTGNVGIGTTNPGAKLHIKGLDGVSGGIRLDGDTYITRWYMSSNTNVFDLYNSNQGIFEFKDSGETKLYLDGNGNVSGFYGNYHTASDIRLKKNVAVISDALQKVSQLRGVNFTWKDGSDNGSLQMGMVAQEVEKVVPEVVHTADDKMKTKAIEYPFLVGLLVEAIKQLKDEKDAEIVALKADNDGLKAQFAGLETENEALKNTLAALATEISDIKVALRQNNQLKNKLAKAGGLGNIKP